MAAARTSCTKRIASYISARSLRIIGLLDRSRDGKFYLRTCLGIRRFLKLAIALYGSPADATAQVLNSQALNIGYVLWILAGNVRI